VTARNGEDTPVTTWVSTLRNLTITVPEYVTQELDDLSLAISFGRGAQAPLDTHEPLWRVKCAALVALLHGRTAVTADDWDMAALLWRTSQKSATEFRKPPAAACRLRRTPAGPRRS
jgi:hypothetical protein